MCFTVQKNTPQGTLHPVLCWDIALDPRWNLHHSKPQQPLQEMNTHLEPPCLAPSSRRYLESEPADSSSTATRPAHRNRGSSRRGSRRASASLATVAALLQIASATSTITVSPLRLHDSARGCAHPLPDPRPLDLPLSRPDNTVILRMRGGMPLDAFSVRMLASATRQSPAASFRRSAQPKNNFPGLARRVPKLSRTTAFD